MVRAVLVVVSRDPESPNEFASYANLLNRNLPVVLAFRARGS
jgi:hypothetical protein